MTRSTGDYVRIATAGGGLIIDAKNMAPGDMVRIVTAAANSGAQVTFTSCSAKSVGDLTRVAAAGPRCVTFET